MHGQRAVGAAATGLQEHAPDTTCAPSPLWLMQVTASVCPRMRAMHAPACAGSFVRSRFAASTTAASSAARCCASLALTLVCAIVPSESPTKIAFSSHARTTHCAGCGKWMVFARWPEAPFQTRQVQSRLLDTTHGVHASAPMASPVIGSVCTDLHQRGQRRPIHHQCYHS